MSITFETLLENSISNNQTFLFSKKELKRLINEGYKYYNKKTSYGLRSFISDVISDLEHKLNQLEKIDITINEMELYV